jgi:hypothetical protein
MQILCNTRIISGKEQVLFGLGLVVAMIFDRIETPAFKSK